MTVLKLDQIFRETESCDAASVTSLHLSHRALSDVSCLSKFLNLERLDLSFNCLSSLEGLSSCVNLKWLSVVENKLETLKGIQGLSKLTVFNAGKNKLQTIDEISSVTSLRALILNDNNISSICKLDQLKYLNTLVLSRNPIYEIGNSLMKAKSLTKLSLSHCQLQKIGSSLASCLDLKELRLSHNQITTIPCELERNIRLQNLDMGNNLIEKWSELKVLSALPNLKNLNLQGNPIAEDEKLSKKVKKSVPNLRIFNAKPLEGSNRSEKPSRQEISHPNSDDPLQNASDVKAEKAADRQKSKVSKPDVNPSGINIAKRSSEEVHALPSYSNIPVENETKRKKSKTSSNIPKNNISDQTKGGNNNNGGTDPKAAKKAKSGKSEKKGITMSKEIDDAEIPFVDLILSNEVHEDQDSEIGSCKAVPDAKLLGGLVVEHAKKKKKARNTATGPLALQLLAPNLEVGLGGQSTWDD